MLSSVTHDCQVMTSQRLSWIQWIRVLNCQNCNQYVSKVTILQDCLCCCHMSLVRPALVPTLVDLSKGAAANWLLALDVLQLKVVLVWQVGPQVEHIDLLLCHASDPGKVDSYS